MDYRAFGTSGLQVSVLGIGAVGGGRGPDEVVAAMNELLDAGCNLVDTAQVYGDHEQLIGQHLAHRRKEMMIVSKCGHHDVLADGSMRSRPISMADIDQALSRLRCDYVDAMLLHSYDLEPLMQGDAIAVLLDAKRAGKIRMVGYSGDNERAAWAAQCPDIEVLEVSVNIADQHNIAAVLEPAAARGVGVILKRPLANAAWLRQRGRDKVHESVLTYADRLQALNFGPTIYGCQSMDELALRFAISVPGAHSVIASCGNPEHRQRNLQLVAAGPLAAEHYQALRGHWLAQAARSAADEPWLGVN